MYKLLTIPLRMPGKILISKLTHNIFRETVKILAQQKTFSLDNA